MILPKKIRMYKTLTLYNEKENCTPPKSKQEIKTSVMLTVNFLIFINFESNKHMIQQLVTLEIGMTISFLNCNT